MHKPRNRTTAHVNDHVSGFVPVSNFENGPVKNAAQAARNRAYIDAHGTLAINLMSSPGSGKTTLLEETIEALRNTFKIAVIEGDLNTENDAERIRAKGAPAIQIKTSTSGYLDAHMVDQALNQLILDGVDILFIENVGNLVCPTQCDVGQHRNVVLLSVTEGDDKPVKYPNMFRTADVVLLTKTDLLQVVDDFDAARVGQYLLQLGSDAPLMPLSAKRHSAMRGWFNWLHLERDAQRTRVAAGKATQPLPKLNGAPVSNGIAA